MKKILFYMLFFNVLLSNAQTEIVSFDYDMAGNQTKRQLCLTCHDKNSADEIIAAENLTEEDLKKFFPQDVISYYPNPVKEELFLKWELIDGKNVNSLEIYSLSGQLLKKFSNLDSVRSFNVSFNSFPLGTYILLLHYSNGEQKDIQIIKK